MLSIVDGHRRRRARCHHGFEEGVDIISVTATMRCGDFRRLLFRATTFSRRFTAYISFIGYCAYQRLAGLCH